MQLSPLQHNAIDKAVSALANGSEFVIGGLAGTGKTTILQQLAAAIPDCHVIAPTNKACSVLRAKGIKEPITIHRLAYDLVGSRLDDNGVEEPIFREKDFSTEVALVDESSMVGLRSVSHLRNRIRSICWVGDHGQLPPVKAENPDLFYRMDVELKEIFRQADGSPIIDYAYALRQGEPLSYRVPGATGGVHFSPSKSLDRIAKTYPKIEVFIVHSNRFRNSLNRAVRKHLGFGEAPQKGDLVMALSNNHRIQIYNGEIHRVTEVQDAKDCWLLSFDKHPIYGTVRRAYAPKEQFNLEHRLPQDEMPGGGGLMDANVMLFDFGYAITAHKSQGSQWKNVGLVDPGYTYRDAEAWNYTAATRAADNLLVFGA